VTHFHNKINIVNLARLLSFFYVIHICNINDMVNIKYKLQNKRHLNLL